jgi:S1-C subfamily serine protease
VYVATLALDQLAGDDAANPGIGASIGTVTGDPTHVSLGLVQPDGPAASAGLEQGDVILTIDGADATGPAAPAAASLLHFLPPHRTITLTVARGDQTISATITKP